MCIQGHCCRADNDGKRQILVSILLLNIHDTLTLLVSRVDGLFRTEGSEVHHRVEYLKIRMVVDWEARVATAFSLFYYIVPETNVDHE